MTKDELISKVIAFAESRVGYLEKSAEAYKKDRDIVFSMLEGAGSDNRCEAWEVLKPSFNQSSNAWCQGFVHFVFCKALGGDNARKVLYLDDWKPAYEPYTNYACASWRENFELHNAKVQSSKAEVGDIIYFKKSHTGIVYKVTTDTIYTIEGNTSGASGVIRNGGGVCKKSYVRGSDSIRCYGRPNWEAISKRGRDTLYRGYKGEDAGYFQRCMNALNILDENGNRLVVDNSYGGHSVAACGNFQKARGITIDGVCGNQTWNEIDKALNSTSKIEAVTVLNVRKGASTSHQVIGTIKPGTIYEVSATNNGWLYLPKVGGWVSDKYVKFV